MTMLTTPYGAFDFLPCVKNGAWNEVGGVYMFVGGTALGGPNVYYVGLCDNFKNRIPTHERWDEAVRLGG